MSTQWENSKLYQIKKFLFKSSNPIKDIIIVIPHCNQTGADRCLNFVDFCLNLLGLLPEEKGEYIGTRICSYSYYFNSYALVKNWSSNKKEVNEGVGSKSIFLLIKF